ncbi:DUF6950 family protein [Cereibacter sphaeroides]|jgi:hypothetical protein|uniref:DUF6950 family protein n=1 Tax=Cereibacter sphaeroides TaxID=1063 RepID=UPI0000664099|nr:hypothetical protein Rsph17029_0631 [Cereibacter sphaeroides ATCC 17029]
MRRREDWRSRLWSEIDRQAREPFGWGRQDCAIGLACGAVQAVTGEDVGAEWRGRYDSPGAGLRIVLKRAKSLGDFVALHLEEQHPVFARVGDIGIVEAEGPFGEALCVVDVSRLIVQTDSGLGSLPRDRMLRAFKVG